MATINNTIYAESSNVPISTGQITLKNLKIEQQQITVSGRVTDNNGNPMAGVSVAEKGKPSEQITDQDGKYQIKVASAGTLVFTFVGYETVEMRIQGKDVINVNMRSNIQDLDEVVVIGYTSQKKSLLTGAVSTMKVDETLKTLPTTSAGNMLIGKLAGVNVNTVDAVPGAQPNVSIRTGSSLNDQNVTYVIDGVVRGGGDFNNLSPNEIEDITVLKDAASAAIYGSRSAGGVIIVTTKKGTRGKPTFNFSSAYSVDTRTKNVALTSAVQAGELYGRINGFCRSCGLGMVARRNRSL
ncbi:carboxypeptidase-like regulatory domain-containing protein [Sphingobacterium sp. SG20118]|uniref:carboxypeptidase-like regulatory domain-containing protein n=1 Tax=Sphingobacterium sp. SG20118 TaxID=3367156 RepID=UPI0037DFC618